MGAGKTTLGKKLAKALGVPFLDTDDLFEAKYEMSIPEYFALHGEERFRVSENLVLKNVLNSHAVISTGGGMPCYQNNMELMNKWGITVFLDRPAGELCNRLLKAKKKRPLIEGKNEVELLEYIENNLTYRLPFYQQAQITAGREEQTIEKLLELLDQTR